MTTADHPPIPTTPDAPDTTANAHKRHHHPPVRTSKEVRLPLAVRKELLMTRAALERHDAVLALRDTRLGMRRAVSLTNWMHQATKLTKPSGWLGMLGVTKKYPLVSTAVTLSLPLLRKLPIGRLTWKLGKLGALLGAAYWAYQTYTEASAQAVPPPIVVDSETIEPAGFRDPLVP